MAFHQRRGTPGQSLPSKAEAHRQACRVELRPVSNVLTEGRYDKRKKIEVSCKDRPVCEHFYLHRFRKTCATRWHEACIPIRTIQNWLGHKSLETTMIYLGVTDSEKLRSNINAAFTH